MHLAALSSCRSARLCIAKRGFSDRREVRREEESESNEPWPGEWVSGETSQNIFLIIIILNR